MSKVCYGCGSILQSDNELLPGFIPKEKIDNANYCKRCFRLTHYGDITNKKKKKSTKQILNNMEEWYEYETTVAKEGVSKKYIISVITVVAFVIATIIIAANNC